MDTANSPNRKFTGIVINILSIVIILAMAFPVTGSVYAQETAPKVGLITYLGGVTDNGFNWMAYQGLLQAETNLGIVKSLYVPATDTEFDAMLDQCADEGNGLCIAVGFNYGISVANAARENPGTNWAIVDWSYPDCWEGAIEGVDCGSFTDLPNVRGLKFNEKQSGYLAGVLAGAMTTSNIVGAVGGMEIPPVVAFVEGYRNGAQCTNHAVNVMTTYTGTFSDPGLGATTAQEMIEQGADVIFGAAGSTGDGAIMYSAQNGQWAIGVDADQYLTVFGEGAVAGSDRLLTSAMKRVDNAVYQTIENYINDGFTSGTIVYDLVAGGVGLAPFHETDGSIPQDVKDKLEVVKQGIIDGTVNIDDPCNPFIAVSLTQHWFWVNNFLPETLVTFYIYGNQGDEAPIFEFRGNTDASGNVTIEGWEHTWNPEPDNFMVATDGVHTKELLLAYITLDIFDPQNDVVSGHTSPGREVGVGVGNADGEQWMNVVADADGVWTADFKIIGFNITEDMWAGGHVNDEDGDVTAAHNSGPSGPPEFLLYDIYIFNPESGSVQRLTQLDLLGEYNPSWSPNGKKIAHDVVYKDGSQSIYITDVDTGESTPLAGAEGGNDSTWSPNGKWIAFDRNSNLFLVPSGGGEAISLRENAVSAGWAPNGKRLVFQDTTDGSLWTMPVDGGKGVQTQITASGANPVWSLDGNWIAYEMDGDIWKVQVNVQGTVFGDAIQMTSGPFSDGQPTWAADSQTIIYHSGFTSDWDLWSVPAAGGMPTWINGAPNSGDYDPANARNSSNIAYASTSSDGQAARVWGAAFTYDAGSWAEGDHSYHLENAYTVPEPGGEISDSIQFTVTNEAPQYDGNALLRFLAMWAYAGEECQRIEPPFSIQPNQNLLFHYGWVTTAPMTYAEAVAHFDSMTVTAYWDEGMSADLSRHEIFPWTSVDWTQYICSATSP